MLEGSCGRCATTSAKDKGVLVGHNKEGSPRTGQATTEAVHRSFSRHDGLMRPRLRTPARDNLASWGVRKHTAMLLGLI
jgi:hypothetical protein